MNRAVLIGIIALAAVVLWSVNYGSSNATASLGCHGAAAPEAVAACSGAVQVAVCSGPTRGQLRRDHRRAVRETRRALRQSRRGCGGVAVAVGCGGVSVNVGCAG